MYSVNKSARSGTRFQRAVHNLVNASTVYRESSDGRRGVGSHRKRVVAREPRDTVGVRHVVSASRAELGSSRTSKTDIPRNLVATILLLDLFQNDEVSRF